MEAAPTQGRSSCTDPADHGPGTTHRAAVRSARRCIDASTTGEAPHERYQTPFGSSKYLGPRDSLSRVSFWVPKFDGDFAAHVEAHLARAAAVYEHETRQPCQFDRSTLEWLDTFTRGFVARQPEQVEVMMTAFGIVIGETVRRETRSSAFSISSRGNA